MPATLEQQQRSNEVDPEGGESSSRIKAWQCPPHVLTVAQTNAERALVLIFRDAATQVLWSPAFLALFLQTTGRGYHQLIGRTQLVMGSAELVSKMVEHRRLDPHWTIRLAALIGVGATAVSLRFLLLDGFGGSWFGTLSIANGLWGLQWGIAQTSLSSIGVDSWAVMAPPSVAAHESYLPQLSQRWNHTAVGGRVFGTLLAGGVVLGLGTSRWGDWENCLVLVVGAATNLACWIPLVGLRSIRSVDAHVYAKCQRALHQELELRRQSQLPAKAKATDTAEETATANATRTLGWINGSLMLSALADGISAWYLPVVLVEQTDISPLSFQFLSLIVLAKDHFLLPRIQTQLIGRWGRYPTCLLVPLVSAGLVGAMALLCDGPHAPRLLGERWKWQAMIHLYLWQVDSTDLLPKILPDALPEKVQLVPEFRLRMMCVVGGLLGRHLAGYGLWVNLYGTAVLKILAGLSLLVLCCYEKDPAWTREENEDDPNGKPRSQHEKDILPPVPTSSFLLLLRKTLPHCLVAGLIFALYQRESKCSFSVRKRCWCTRWRARD